MTTNAQIATWLTRVEAKLDRVLTAPAPEPAPQPQPVPAPAPVPVPGIAKTAAQLIAEKWVVPYTAGVPIYPNYSPKDTSVYAYGPGAWSSVGLTDYMPSTGERPEIGVETDATAEWLMGGSPNNMLAQAKAVATLPIFATIDGCFIDVLKYPKASFDPRESPSPYFDASHPTITLDIAHLPSLSYVAYLATGDLQYLRNLQACATYVLAGGPNSYAQGKGIVYPWQTRMVAWGLREIFKTYFATPEGAVVPPLLPKSYWKQVLDNNLAWFKQEYLTKPIVTSWSETDAARMAVAKNAGILAPVQSKDGDIAVFQQDYLLQVMGWAIWTGRVPEWRPVYDQLAKQIAIRGTGPLRSQACQYWLNIGTATDWPSLLAFNGLSATADDNYPPDIAKNVPHYPGSFRMAAKLAVLNGVPGADAAFVYADAQAKRIGLIVPRHAV